VGLIIRKAKDGEIREIAEICRDEIYNELSLDWVLDWLKSITHPYLQYFIAEEDGEIVGFIDWTLYDRYGQQVMLEISLMAVKEERQRKGIGTRLVEESLEKIKEFWATQSLRIVMFMVETEDENEAAQKFYNKILKPFHKRFVPDVWEKEGGKVFYFKDLK
jgi:ribosomal protein S18 acetylase RimI-like enzyme